MTPTDILNQAREELWHGAAVTGPAYSYTVVDVTGFQAGGQFLPSEVLETDDDEDDDEDVELDAIAPLEHVFRFVAGTPWAIKPETLAVITDLISVRMSGHHFTDDEINERMLGASLAARRGGPSRSGAVALLSLYGVIAPRASMVNSMSGPSGTGLDQFSAGLDKAVNDPEVGSIVIDVNSPGGTVDLVPETAARIRAARQVKPIYAVANTDAASAAYWLASQATELSVTPSGAVGSIGVYAAHQDLSAKYEAAGVKTTLISAGKYKTEATPFQALSEEARANIQSMVDEYYGMFVDEVAKGRGRRASSVRSGFGEGRMVSAKAAVAEGMADRIDTLDGVISRALRGGPVVRSANAEDDIPSFAGDTVPDQEVSLEHLRYVQL